MLGLTGEEGVMGKRHAEIPPVIPNRGQREKMVSDGDEGGDRD